MKTLRTIKQLHEGVWAALRGQTEPLRQMIAEEMRLPDVKWRHLFTARLRLIVFIGVWVMLFVFYPNVWKTAPLVPLIFNLGFFATVFCYKKNKL